MTIPYKLRKVVVLKNMCDACCGDGHVGENKDDCEVCGGSGIEIILPKIQTVHERVLTVYREQLKTFKKLGIGGVTQYNTKVTQALVDITEKRMRELLYNKFNQVNNE